MKKTWFIRAVLAASGLKPHSGAAIRLLLPSDN